MHCILVCRMFYFYFESRGDKAKDPLVVWMTGGPGCSSEVALFFENGPYIINNDNKTLSWSDYGWDMVWMRGLCEFAKGVHIL